MTTPAFDDNAVYDVFSRLESHAMATGRFDAVNTHEPKSAPGNGVYCSIWSQTIKPVRTSGLAATSALVVFNARVYVSFTQQPFDAIDPNVMAATVEFMGVLSGDFELGGADNVREIDLLGANGLPLAAAAGYVEIDRKMFRVMTITIPIVINDIWVQTPIGS